jgi:hypothetical protein
VCFTSARRASPASTARPISFDAAATTGSSSQSTKASFDGLGQRRPAAQAPSPR